MSRREGLIKELQCLKCGGDFKLSKSSFEQYQPSEMVCQRCNNKIEPRTYLLIQEYCLARERALIERVEKPLNNAIAYGKRVDDRVDRWKVAQVYEDCIDEAQRILEQAKKGTV
jgi:DNA-directed RNA polymerase subunit RPC12/RpoP